MAMVAYASIRWHIQAYARTWLSMQQYAIKCEPMLAYITLSSISSDMLAYGTICGHMQAMLACAMVAYASICGHMLEVARV